MVWLLVFVLVTCLSAAIGVAWGLHDQLVIARKERDELRLDVSAWETVARVYSDDTTRKFEQARAVLVRLRESPPVMDATRFGTWLADVSERAVTDKDLAP